MQLENLKNILPNLIKFNTSYEEKHQYINSLSTEDYASLSTAFIIGRSGWDRTSFEETKEYYDFIMEMQSRGEELTNEMIDKKFLTKELKMKQLSLTYNYALENSVKSDGEYNHNWLSQKSNLISTTQFGINLISTI